MRDEYEAIIYLLLFSVLGAMVFIIIGQLISRFHDVMDFIFRRNTPRLFKIATPCSQLWSDFQGDSKIRHCGLCDKNVHNVCKLSRSERNKLRRRMEEGERVCIYIEPSFLRKLAGLYTITVVSLCSYIGISVKENDHVWNGSAGGAFHIKNSKISPKFNDK